MATYGLGAKDPTHMTEVERARQANSDGNLSRVHLSHVDLRLDSGRGIEPSNADLSDGVDTNTIRVSRDYILAMDVSKDGRKLAVANPDGTVSIWNLATGTKLVTIDSHTHRNTPRSDAEYWVSFVMFGNDSRRVVTGDTERITTIWDTETGKALFTFGRDPKLPALDRAISTSVVDFSADGKLVVGTDGRQTATVYNASSGQIVSKFTGHTDFIACAAFSPDGSRVITGGDDRTACVWDSHTGQKLFDIKGFQHRVSAVAFSRDGTKISTASIDGTLKVWNATDGSLKASCKGHLGFVGSASFSPDGKRIVSGGGDNAAHIWNAETGADVRTLKEHSAIVRYALYTPDGSRIVTGSNDGTVKVWDVMPDKVSR